MHKVLRSALLILGSVAGAALAAPPVVEDAWARATPPSAKTGAVYLTLTADPADRLLGARSPAAREVQIHTHATEGGMSRMVQLPELALPAGSSVRLEPGGLHLMLIDLVQPLVAGQSISVTLELADAGEVELTATVRDAREQPSSNAERRHESPGAL